MGNNPSKSPSLFTLILLCGLSVLTLSMFLPSLANIAETFNADYAVVNLAIAGYAAMTAVVLLIAGPLSDRFGRRPIMLGALTIFSLASLGCLLAQDVWTFLAFRLLQAAIISGYAISMAVIRDTRTTEKAASLIGYMSAVWAIAPMLGPMIGGTLDEAFGWRANLAVLFGIGVLMLVLCWANLHETNLTPSSTFRSQFRSYGGLFNSGRFWGYSLSIAFGNGAFYVFLGGAPLVAKFIFEISTAELGFYMGTITIGFVLGSFLAGRYSANFPLTTTMLTGRVIACAGLITGLILWFYGFTNIQLYFSACAAVGVGNGLTVPPSTAGVMSVNQKLAGSAAGLNGAMAVGVGAVMAAIGGALLTETNAAYTLMLVMLVSSGLSMLATCYLIWLDTKFTPAKHSQQ